MKEYVIGIDHGYGYIKTKKYLFDSGVKELVSPSFFKDDLLYFDNTYYAVGQSRTEHTTVKTESQEYYLLTLAALAKELRDREGKRKETVKAAVTIGAGLPYAFIQSQSEGFRKYLMKNRRVVFWFEGQKFDLEIGNVYLFPQGFPVIAEQVGTKGTIHVVDIGSRTVDIITFRDGKAYYEQSVTLDNMGTLDCIEDLQRAFLDSYQMTVKESIFQDCLRGTITEKFTNSQKEMIENIIHKYIEGILKEVSKYVDFQFDDCVVCGGGASSIQKYATSKLPVKFQTDIHANAAGFEKLAIAMKALGQD